VGAVLSQARWPVVPRRFLRFCVYWVKFGSFCRLFLAVFADLILGAVWAKAFGELFLASLRFFWILVGEGGIFWV